MQWLAMGVDPKWAELYSEHVGYGLLWGCLGWSSCRVCCLGWHFRHKRRQRVRLKHAAASAQERTAVRSAVDSKVCRRCQGVKGAGEFYTSKQTSDGLQSYCKVCYAQTSQGRRAKEPKEHRERQPGTSPCATSPVLSPPPRSGLDPEHSRSHRLDFKQEH